MTKVEPFKIAIAGVGTVGGGVLEILNKKKSIFSSKGIDISLSAVATRKSVKKKLIKIYLFSIILDVQVKSQVLMKLMMADI